MVPISIDYSAKLQSAPSASFDGLFVESMTQHHEGAVGRLEIPPRNDLRLMAHAIRHEQQGEIAPMHGMHGALWYPSEFSRLLRNIFSVHGFLGDNVQRTKT
jgi:hypothetical protein